MGKRFFSILAFGEQEHFNEILKFTNTNEYSLSECKDINDFFKITEENIFDIIIVDYFNATINSLDAVNIIKKHYPIIPVIFTSSIGNFDLACSALEAGADHILSKPIRKGQFDSVIKKSIKYTDVDEKYIKKEHDVGLQCVVEYLDKNFTKPVNQTDIVKMSGNSRSSLYKKFNEQFGMSVSQYIQLKKISLAKHLLKTTDEPINIISDEIGVNDCNYFCRWFKKETNTTPLNYRKNINNRSFEDVICALVNSRGAYSRIGEGTVRGIEYAVNEARNKYHRDFDIKIIDTLANTNLITEKINNAIEKSGVKFFIGCNHSQVAIEASETINSANALLFTSAGCSYNGSRYRNNVFRWSTPIPVAVKNTVKPFLNSKKNIKNVYTVTADYIFGYNLLSHARDILKNYGVNLLGNSYHPVGCSDFSPFFKDAYAKGADCVVLLNYGDDSFNSIKYAKKYGYGQESPVLIPWSNGLNDVMFMENEVPESVYIGSQYWPEEKNDVCAQLKDDWVKTYKCLPSYSEVAGYIEAKILIEGIIDSKSRTIDKVKNNLLNKIWKGPTGEEYFQAGNNQTIKKYYLIQPQARNRKITAEINSSLVYSGI